MLYKPEIETFSIMFIKFRCVVTLKYVKFFNTKVVMIAELQLVAVLLFICLHSMTYMIPFLENCI